MSGIKHYGIVMAFLFTLKKYILRAGIGRSKERYWRRISGPFVFFHGSHGGGYVISFLFPP